MESEGGYQERDIMICWGRRKKWTPFCFTQHTLRIPVYLDRYSRPDGGPAADFIVRVHPLPHPRGVDLHSRVLPHVRGHPGLDGHAWVVLQDGELR